VVSVDCRFEDGVDLDEMGFGVVEEAFRSRRSSYAGLRWRLLRVGKAWLDLRTSWRDKRSVCVMWLCGSVRRRRRGVVDIATTPFPCGSARAGHQSNGRWGRRHRRWLRRRVCHLPPLVRCRGRRRHGRLIGFCVAGSPILSYRCAGNVFCDFGLAAALLTRSCCLSNVAVREVDRRCWLCLYTG